MAAFGAAAVMTGVAAAAPAAAADNKISAKVSAQVADGGTTTFWVMLRGGDDLAATRKATGKAKAGAVYRDVRAGANRDQAGLRTLLGKRKAPYQAYWIADTMRVTGNAALLAAVAARPEVKAVLPDEPVKLPAVQAGTAQAEVSSVEWNVDRINAPRVWSERGDTGAGIVVANVDTGVQFDHPALAASYRGRNADGSVSHDYNWYDPSHTCADNLPCDNSGHGTHTMGTMAGADGLGVAPGVKWIAAKGCESNSCSVGSLLAAGQWIVAPTDRAGNNPRPDLAPDVVNNSWGGGSGFDPWYSEIVSNWVGAGIFPAFSNGNNGPICGSASTPGSYAATYASGAFDVNNAIASFSSRGFGQDGAVKPDIAAPGVDVRSSVPGGYGVYSGTSMASPHTAATVALIWAAAPALRHDIAATREILDETAIDTDDTSCGGTAADNNVWGQGRLDAYAAVTLAVSPSGSLAGTVTGEGFPISGAAVTIGGRSLTTAADGGFRFARLVAGNHHVRISAFGYDTFEGDVSITAGGSARLDAALTTSASAVLSGLLTSGGSPVPGVSVALTGTPVSVTSDSGGHYRLAAPFGSYEVVVHPAGGCASGVTRQLTLSGDQTLDLELPLTSDHYGYTCAAATEGYREGDQLLALTGDDSAASVTLPFSFPLYGVAHTQAWVGTNGLIAFDGASTSFANTDLPLNTEPNDALYPFWDDLYVDAAAAVYTASTADTFVVEWRNVMFFGDATQRVSVSAILHADGTVTYRYRGPVGERATGTSATIGIENIGGTDGLAYAYLKNAVRDGSGVTLHPPANRIAATFNVTMTTVWGQNLYVVGSIPELGQWDPARAVPLSAATYPIWSASLTLPPNTAIEFKYLIKNADSSWAWESTSNRSTVTPPTGQYITHDTFNQH
ncbi:peptidase S8 [Paractinoplanes durhamensis]|uniref:alpha-amylase n=1 Tax=Paractinoplanes durhamensis TaxID=113563 RepID=A0ABQ3YWF4_9ACTN|nr:peptidase S8 [Actinoplanes durhamensis]